MTQQNRIELTLPERLLKIIDENRGSLSRAEFIDLCVESFIESNERSSLLQLRRDEGLKRADSKFEDRFVMLEKVRPDNVLKWLWCLAIAAYGFGDIISSYFAFKVGLVELNPLISFLGNIVSIIFFKIATLIGIFLISYFFFNEQKWSSRIVPLLTGIVGIFLTVNNILKILSLRGIL